MMSWATIIVHCLCLTGVVGACGYETCHITKAGMLNVHLVPSTHLDMGWLKTMDQYYYGTRSWVQKAGVRYILESVVKELMNTPSRRFALSETGYLWKWWTEQSSVKQEQMRQLVTSGQLEIVNGGWVTNDEAVTTYQAVIDQYTWGFRRLTEMFGEQCSQPRAGWQIGAHGHSQQLAALYSLLGYDGIFVAHVNFLEKLQRLRSGTMEMMWAPAASVDTHSHVFTSILYHTHTPPDGFCFDVLCNNDGIVDIVGSKEYNLDVKVDQFIMYCEEQARDLRTDNILVLMGGDFHFQSAATNYINMDRLIQNVNTKQQTGSRVRVFYSTPSCYLQAVNNVSNTWSVKNNDFLPYADDLHSYWTGYYSSRPSLKYLERIANNYLQICKQLLVLARLEEQQEGRLNVLREAVATLQGHNAISGTCRQQVADDFRDILLKGFQECDQVINTAILKLSTNSLSIPGMDEEEKDSNISDHFIVTSCLLKNISECTVSETSTNFVVTVYNPLSHNVSHHVRLPVPDGVYSVQDHDGDGLVTQLVPIPVNVLHLPGRKSKATAELVFTAMDIPPMGFLSYYVTREEDNGEEQPSEDAGDDDDIGNQKYISNERLQIYFSPVNGQVKELNFSPEGNGNIILMQNFHYYPSKGSGAYLFRPANESENVADKCSAVLLTFKGEVVEEVHQTFTPWISQVVRLYKTDRHVEFEWLVGPIPLDNVDGGMDVITRYTTNLDNDGVFYTDANGREMVKRELTTCTKCKAAGAGGSAEPVAANYYPVSSRILIRDVSENLEFAVLTDRPQGGSSLRKGEIELTLHRRFSADDLMGLNEALNEEEGEDGMVVRGRHYVVAGRSVDRRTDKDIDSSAESVAMYQRMLSQKILNSPWVFLNAADSYSFKQWKNTFLMSFRGLHDTLPQNVRVLSLEPWKDRTVLLRLEHVMEPGEDETMCRAASVDLDELFIPFPIVSVEEVTLGANQPLCDLNKLSWRYFPACKSPPRKCFQQDRSGLNKILLEPLQIRTFVVDIKN